MKVFIRRYGVYYEFYADKQTQTTHFADNGVLSLFRIVRVFECVEHEKSASWCGFHYYYY